MGEILRENLSFYISAAFFITIISIIGIFGTRKKNEDGKNKLMVKRLVIGIAGGVAVIGLFCTIVPLSLANYEYEQNLVEEREGTIEEVKISKDKITLWIDGYKYTMSHSHTEEMSKIEKKVLKRGMPVEFVVGVKSKFIFDIYKKGTSSFWSAVQLDCVYGSKISSAQKSYC